MIENKARATNQTGIAIFVKNNKGMPVKVIPMTESIAINPKQILWQTCQEPKILAAPEMLPDAPISFSLIDWFGSFIFPNGNNYALYEIYGFSRIP